MKHVTTLLLLTIAVAIADDKMPITIRTPSGEVTITRLSPLAVSALFEIRAVVERTNPGAEAIMVKYPDGQETLYLDRVPLLDHRSVKRAEAPNKPKGYGEVTITLTPAGAERLKEFATKNVGGRLAIFFNGKISSSPLIREPSLQDILPITGIFSAAEAKELAQRINEAAQRK